MIVDFTVTNFRSIKDEQTFSLYVETAGSHLTEHVSYPAGDKIGVLKSAGLYGANASGKSNLLLAFKALQHIVTHSGDLKEGDNIPFYEPYLLSEETKVAPTRFEIEFFVPSSEQAEFLRYRYCLAFTANEVIEESLIFYPSTQKAMIFNRSNQDSWQTIRFGSLYKGGKKRLPFFKNNAYLSKAGNSADSPPMIQSIYNWIRNDLIHLHVNQVQKQLNWFEDSILVKRVANLLSLVDTGIDNIKIQEEQNNNLKLPDTFDILPDRIKQEILKHANHKLLFSHLTEIGSTELFEEEQESDGTRKLFHLAPLLIQILSEGGILIMDELDNSMHPFMAELIIKLFNDPRVNKRSAQLIFSTHNIGLMSPESLRRDQIWLTEKQQSATVFYSVDDFDKKKVKPQSPFNQWYVEGRFGAIPAIDYQGIIQLFDQIGKSNA